MSVDVSNRGDVDVARILDALAGYGADHPGARIEAYRKSNVSIYARIIDPDFAGISRGDRHEAIWRRIEGLPEDVQTQLSVLLLLTPAEAIRSPGSLEFDHPIPSDL
jgi:hypothetical protein